MTTEQRLSRWYFGGLGSAGKKDDLVDIKFLIPNDLFRSCMCDAST